MARFVGVRGFVVVDGKYLVEHTWLVERDGAKGEISTLKGHPHYVVERSETALHDCGVREEQCLRGVQEWRRCAWCVIRLGTIVDIHGRHLKTVKLQPAVPVPMTTVRYPDVKPADFIIHVHGPTLNHNLERKTNARVVVVRDARSPDEFVLCREMRVVRGEVAVVHQPRTPLSFTGDRAVSWVTVKQGVVEVKCHDDEEFMACHPGNREVMDVKPLSLLPKLVDSSGDRRR